MPEQQNRPTVVAVRGRTRILHVVLQDEGELSDGFHFSNLELLPSRIPLQSNHKMIAIQMDMAADSRACLPPVSIKHVINWPLYKKKSESATLECISSFEGLLPHATPAHSSDL
jgi:hypothetical protein